jgi:hypothetical protein
MFALGERLAGLVLNPDLALPDVIEFWESTVDISDYLFPFLRVEAWVALRDLTNDDPSIELRDILVQRVCIDRSGGSLLEADRAHVMVVAVVDIGSVSRSQAIQQKVVGLVLVSAVSYFHTVLLVDD